MGKEKILVIEDNALNLKLVRSLLMLEDYEVVEADNAETGIQLAKEQHPDLILMDIQLPGMDGLSATRELKADPDVTDIPVVALTAYAMLGDEQKALEAKLLGFACLRFLGLTNRIWTSPMVRSRKPPSQ